MDALRGAAVLLVVLLHAAVLVPGRSGVELPAWTGTVNDALAPVRIPLLVVLSGMLLGPSLGKGSRAFAVGKLRAVAWPFLVWTGVFTVVVMRPGSLGDFLLGASYLWYLLFLLAYYAGAWLLRDLPAGAVAVVAALALAAAVAAPAESKYLERLVYLFALFLLGHLLARRPRLLRWAARSGWAVVLAGLLLLAHVGLGDPAAGYGPGTVGATLAGLLLGARLGGMVGEGRAAAPLRAVGRSSIVYYVAHFPVLVVLAALVGRSGVQHPVVVLLAWVVALLACTALALLRHRPAVSWLFLYPRSWLPRGLLPVAAGVTSTDAVPPASPRR